MIFNLRRAQPQTALCWCPFSSYFTARPISSIEYGFLMYSPAPSLWASLTFPVSENPLVMIAFCPGLLNWYKVIRTPIVLVIKALFLDPEAIKTT